ncbi:MAG: hypothetical protein U0232_25585 [Thermomicrobiales bacterium]
MVGDLKAAEDVENVIADGFQAEEESFGDHGVAVPGGDQRDLALALGELREEVAGRQPASPVRTAK